MRVPLPIPSGESVFGHDDDVDVRLVKTTRRTEQNISRSAVSNSPSRKTVPLAFL